LAGVFEIVFLFAFLLCWLLLLFVLPDNDIIENRQKKEKRRMKRRKRIEKKTLRKEKKSDMGLTHTHSEEQKQPMCLQKKLKVRTFTYIH
jgi:hypothetical protein